MSGPLRNITIAGATGSIGRPILTALLASNTFNLTLLTRPSSSTTPSLPPNIPTHETDYTSIPTLTTLLTNQDALIITLPPTAPSTSHQNLITAAIAAQVKLIIPSEFGSDISNPHVQDFPVFVPKIQLQKFLEDKTRGTGTAWTVVRTGPFLDYCFDIGLFGDFEGRRVRWYDGGEGRFGVTLMGTVGEAVVGVLKRWGEVKGRVVWVKGARVSQRELVGYVKEVVGDEGWEEEEVGTEEVERAAWESFEKDPGNAYGWIVGFLVRAVWGKGYGGDFEKNDNDLVGIKMMTDEEVRGWVRERLSSQ